MLSKLHFCICVEGLRACEKPDSFHINNNLIEIEEGTHQRVITWSIVGWQENIVLDEGRTRITSKAYRGKRLVPTLV